MSAKDPYFSNDKASVSTTLEETTQTLLTASKVGPLTPQSDNQPLTSSQESKLTHATAAVGIMPKKTTQASKQVFRFLDLPPEVRNMIYKLAVPDSIIITSCEEFNAQHFNISLVNKEIHNECMPIFDHEVAITVRLWNQTEEDYACVLKWLLNMTDTRCSRMRTVNFVLNTIFRINVLDVQNRIFVQHVDGRRFNFPRPTDDVDPQRYIPMTFRVEKRRFAGIDKMLYGITPAAGDSGLRVNHLANVLWYVSYHQDAWGESYPLWDQLLARFDKELVRY